MRAVVVVMVLVLAKHGCGVSQVHDEDAVEEFASNAADESFGDRVGSLLAVGINAAWETEIARRAVLHSIVSDRFHDLLLLFLSHHRRLNPGEICALDYVLFAGRVIQF